MYIYIYMMGDALENTHVKMKEGGGCKKSKQNEKEKGCNIV